MQELSDKLRRGLQPVSYTHLHKFMDWENHLIKHLQWSDSITNREAKEHVAREIAATAKDGDVIGAGSGSTVYLTLFELCLLYTSFCSSV